VIDDGGGRCSASFVSWRWFWVECGGFRDRMSWKDPPTLAVELLVQRLDKLSVSQQV
jgi:hypothetical protein